MWANYLGLWILFLFFFFLTLGIWQYARWQIKGPVWKMKWRNFKLWILRKNKGPVKVKKGSVIVDDKAIKDIETKKTDLSAAQDYLEVQGLETKLEKEKEQALKDYESGKNKGLFKKGKKNKKGGSDEEIEVGGTSIFDELGTGDSAQDLLHQADATAGVSESNDDIKEDSIMNSLNEEETPVADIEVPAIEDLENNVIVEIDAKTEQPKEDKTEEAPSIEDVEETVIVEIEPEKK